VINVAVSFRSTSASPPRFYHTHIRLNIPDQTTEEERVLEIDGDGQSVVNLHGHNLASFSKVVLKGGDQGIINLQSSGLETPDSEEGATAAPNATFEYQLKVNHQLERRLPVVPPVVTRLPRNDSITLKLESGKLIHLFAKKQLTFGRSRDNDVAIRFLPRSDEHDQLSRNISRTHMVIDCANEGVLLKDQSSKGIQVNYDPIPNERLLTDRDVGFGLETELAGVLQDDGFSLEMTLFGRRGSDDLGREGEIEWDEICYELLDKHPGPLWQFARQNGIDAVRLRRANNAEDLEEYIALYREVQIGSSGSDDGITLCQASHGSNVARIFYAGRTFWVHTNPGTSLQLDDDRQTQASLIPIGPGTNFSIAQEQIEVLPYKQAL
jgi:hypothetical protein